MERQIRVFAPVQKTPNGFAARCHASLGLPARRRQRGAAAFSLSSSAAWALPDAATSSTGSDRSNGTYVVAPGFLLTVISLQWSTEMSRGLPSMTALLGLLAIAGYQNREKISECLGGLKQSASGTSGQGGTGGLLGPLKDSLGSASPSAGGVLSGGLGELVDRFKQSGQGETADSWVGKGPNK